MKSNYNVPKCSGQGGRENGGKIILISQAVGARYIVPKNHLTRNRNPTRGCKIRRSRRKPFKGKPSPSIYLGPFTLTTIHVGARRAVPKNQSHAKPRPHKGVQNSQGAKKTNNLTHLTQRRRVHRENHFRVTPRPKKNHCPSPAPHLM